MQPTLLAIMGPTASGKTALAEAIADETGWQLINSDAFQVYRGMDIGTAKSSERGRYRLMDVCDPWESYGAGVWISNVLSELEALMAEGRSAIIVGGTLYYVRALFEEYGDIHESPDPELRSALDARPLDSLVAELCRRDPNEAERVDLKNRVRVQRALERLELPKVTFRLPNFSKVKIGIGHDPDGNSPGRIHHRVCQMLAEGWLDEVRQLQRTGVKREDPGMRAHGYRAMWDVVHGVKDIDQATLETAIEVSQYAKRQRTWLRKEPNLVKLRAADEGTALTESLELLLRGHHGKVD